jgi:CheY-like chemotaxis protein
MAPRVLIVDDNVELLGLLATVFEDAGYLPISAQRARPALERIKTDPPDVAVVDILLPDVIGYEVAGALRLAKIPFLLMTGVFKGGKHASDAVHKYGAAGYFEKPFQIDKLVERVVSLVPPPPKAERKAVQASQPPPSSRTEATPPIEVDIDMGAPVEVLEITEARDVVLPGRVTITEAAGHVSVTISGEEIPFKSGLPRRPLEARPPAKAPVSQPSTSRAPSVSGPVSTSRPTSAPPGSRTGQLKDNLPHLISAFYLTGETGELVLQRGQVRKVVYFEKGAPVFAISNLALDRFGQFLVRTGKVEQEELRAAIATAERTGRRTGDVFIEMGLLTESERMYYVGQQVTAIIYSLFAWEEGNWMLAFKRRARSETLKLDLHPANLIMRGIKKLYAPARLQRLLPEDAIPIPAPDPSYLLSDVELESWEARLLSRVDGTRHVSELHQIAGRPPEQVRGFLVGLVSLRILNLTA